MPVAFGIHGAGTQRIVVEGDPLEDIRVLQDKSKLALIVKDGAAFKNSMSPSTATAATHCRSNCLFLFHSGSAIYPLMKRLQPPE